MKRCLLLLVVISSTYVFSQDKYSYSADLKNIQDDEVSVSLLTPKVTQEEIVFSFPKVIPGSYSEKNYGKYIDDFKAFDATGKKLKVNRVNPNQYAISNASSLSKITYKVNDTWDKPEKDFIFQPGGSNIEQGKCVVMNNFAFFGYLEGFRKLPFDIAVSKPASFYASTHLNVEHKSEDMDMLTAENYFTLADNPVFYSVPDTTSFLVGNSRVNVSVISASGVVNSRQVAAIILPMATALKQFFNGLPVKNYQFLYYFENMEKPVAGKKSVGGYGALEHNYSSLYFLPEIDYEPRLKTLVSDVSSHEFLHILTPLNLHSKEIEDFDFINPKMSKHLWLYEGVTEYFAHLVQLQNGLVTEKDFLKDIRSKINQSEEYGNFSMTEMSANVLSDPYKEKYTSVYNRGALIAFLLDIFIREKTNGQKDLKQVVVQLAKQYGPGKPFDDDSLFNDFVAASHPAVRDFINAYIAGDQPLPYKEYFARLGYVYEENKRMDGMFVGRMGLKYDSENKAFVFINVDRKNALGIKNDDAFIAADGVTITSANIDAVWDKYFKGDADNPEASFTIKRDGVELELSGRLSRGYVELKNYVAKEGELTADQKKLHDYYLSLN